MHTHGRRRLVDLIKDDVKIDVREIECEGEEWIEFV
jgi:hypothetical protein